MWLGKAARAIEKVVKPVTGLVNGVGQVCLVAMMLLIVADVALRYAFDLPIAASSEVVEFLLVILVFFGLANTQFAKRHLSIDLVVSRLSPGTRAVFASATQLLCLFGFSLITWRAIIQAESFRATGTTSGVLFMPLHPFLWVLAFGSALFCLAFLVSLLDSLADVVRHCQKPQLGLLLAGAAVLLVVALPMWLGWLPWEINNVTIGLISLGLLVLLIFSRMQVGPVMVLVSFLGLTYLVGPEGSFNFMGLSPFRTATTYSLLALPLFILMGTFCFYGGLGEDIYFTIHKWVGHLRGGVAMTTIGSCAAFAAVSGSSMATTVTVGKVALPEMRRYGYADSLSCGSIAAGGTIGIMIPPSNAFIIYAFLTGVSLGKMFIAGIIPGLLEAFFYFIAIAILMRFNPKLGPPGPKSSWIERLVGLKGSWSILLLFATVMGSIYFGFATPIEAAGVGAFGALLIGLGKRRINLQNFRDSLTDTIRTTTMLFSMLIGASLLMRLMTASDIPFALTDFITALTVPPIAVMAAILFVYIFWGCFLPLQPLKLITVPIFFPLVVALGFDPILFGILAVTCSEIGAITPPFGLNVYVMAGVFRDVPIGTIFRGILPFLISDLIRLVLMLAFPAVVLFLPNMMKF